MWRPRAASLALIAGASLLTLGPKFYLEARSAQVDNLRLNADVAARLQANGYRTRFAPGEPDPVVLAESRQCRAMITNGDRARELRHVFQFALASLGPVTIGYRGRWSHDPASGRSVAERWAQDSARRLGFSFDRPAVLALTASGRCPDLRMQLDQVVAHSRLNTSQSATGDAP